MILYGVLGVHDVEVTGLLGYLERGRNCLKKLVRVHGRCVRNSVPQIREGCGEVGFIDLELGSVSSRKIEEVLYHQRYQHHGKYLLFPYPQVLRDTPATPIF